MSTENLMMQSVNLTIIGMTVVFVFLVMLVFVMKILGYLVKWLEKYYPEPVPAASPAAAPAADNNTLVAIAIAAAKRFKSKN